MKISNIIFNICNIIFWILLIPFFIYIFKSNWGILFYIIYTIMWNLISTIIIYYKNNGWTSVKKLIRILFSSGPILPLTVYGCYCSPKYGVDGRTNGDIPIDDLDRACYEHDVSMLSVKEQYSKLLISKSEYITLKNRGDFKFMKMAISSYNSASGIYLLGLEIGFLFRIIGRTFLK